MTDRVVILMDGGFVKKRLYSKTKKHASADDIASFAKAILQHERLCEKVLFRVFFL